ncbi:unnamed protein product [Caenorhabditis nigoni]
MFNRLLIRIPQHQSETETPPALGYIVFDGVEVAYSTRPSVNILNGISLSLKPEKHTALVGHSGNGKSTLLGGTRIRYTCGEKNVKMLKGQKQRITIAGALVRNPQVMFLDEAVTALDVKTEALVKDFFTLRRQTVKKDPATSPDGILPKICESDNFFMEYGNKELNEKTKWSVEKIENWFVQRRIRNGVLKETRTEPILESLFQKHQFLGGQEKNELEKKTGISWFIMHSWFKKKRQEIIRLHSSVDSSDSSNKIRSVYWNRSFDFGPTSGSASLRSSLRSRSCSQHEMRKIRKVDEFWTAECSKNEKMVEEAEKQREAKEQREIMKEGWHIDKVNKTGWKLDGKLVRSFAPRSWD